MRCGLVDELGSKDDGGHHARHEADGSDDDVPSDVDHYDDDLRCIFSIKHGYFSHRNIGLRKKTRHSLIPVIDITFCTTQGICILA